jgi:hypothetical protein
MLQKDLTLIQISLSTLVVIFYIYLGENLSPKIAKTKNQLKISLEEKKERKKRKEKLD